MSDDYWRDHTRDQREAAFRAALRYALAHANDEAMVDGLPENEVENAQYAFAVACRDYVRAVDAHPDATQWPHMWEPDDTAKLRNQVAELAEQNAWMRATIERNDRILSVFVEHHRQHPLPEDVRKKVLAAMNGVDVDEVTD